MPFFLWIFDLLSRCFRGTFSYLSSIFWDMWIVSTLISIFFQMDTFSYVTKQYVSDVRRFWEVPHVLYNVCPNNISKRCKRKLRCLNTLYMTCTKKKLYENLERDFKDLSAHKWERYHKIVVTDVRGIVVFLGGGLHLYAKVLSNYKSCKWNFRDPTGLI